MSVYLKCLVDTVLEARLEPDTWRPVLAGLTRQPVFSELPEGVRRGLKRFLADGRSPTRDLSELWTACFQALEEGVEPPWTPTPPPERTVLHVANPWDWNHILQLNELAVVLGGLGDDGLLVHDHGILDLPPHDVALQLRRLVADLEAARFRPAAVLAHDAESVPLAMCLAERYECGIEPGPATGADCLYVVGNLTYAGALERARAMLEEVRPERTVTAALLLTENPNALRLLPDVVGYQVGSGALPWGRAAGLGVLLRSEEDPDAVVFGRNAYADREAFAASRDRRPAEEIAHELAEEVEGIAPEGYEPHALVAAGALTRILARKAHPVQPFGWRMLLEGEEDADWHTLLPPFPNLFGTPLSSLGPRPTVAELERVDPEEEQLHFLEWVDAALQNPNEVWQKEDVNGHTYTHYVSVVRREGMEEPLAFVAEVTPHGDEMALNNYTLFLNAAEAEELRFGRLLHRAEPPP